MKPMFMRLKAFGPFAKEVDVSFDRVFDGGLFLIHGRTGAGKTSLLDGLCFSLFGRPSSEEREKDIRGLRSDLADVALMTETELVFAIGETAYRVHRVPTQPTPKKRGEGFTEHKGSAELYRLDGPVSSLRATIHEKYTATDKKQETDFAAFSWIPLAGKVEAVDEAIENLLGMNEQQFRQVVVLPQGKFREFLSSTSTERQEILEKLFQTNRFSRLQQFITSRARGTQAAWETASGNLQAKLTDLGLASFEDIGARKNEITAAADIANASLLSARKNVETLNNQLNRARELESATTRLQELRYRLETLTSQNPAIASSERELLAGRAWAPYFLLEDTVSVAKAKQNEIEKLHAAATLSAADFDKQNLMNLEKIRVLFAKTPSTADLTTELTRLRELVPILREISRAQEQLANDKKLDLKAKQEIERLTEGQTRLTHERKTFLSEAFAIHESLLNAESIKIENEDRRIKGVELKFHVSEAARLAATLKQDEPCPVCGSTTHPNPARAHNVDSTAAASTTSRSVTTLPPAINAQSIAKEKTEFDRLRLDLGARQSKRETQLEPYVTTRPALRPKNIDASATVFTKALDLYESTVERIRTNVQTNETLCVQLATRAEASLTPRAYLEEKLQLVPTADCSLAEITDRGVRLKTEIETRTLEMKTAEDAKTKTGNEIARTQGSLATLSDERTRQTNEVANLKKDLSELEASLTEPRPDTRLTATEITSLLTRIENHRHAIVKNEAAIQEIETSIQRMRSDHGADSEARASQELEAKLAQANTERAALEERATRLKVEAESLAKLEKETAVGQTKLASLKQEAERAVRMSALLSGDRSQNKLLVPLSRFVLQSRFEEVLEQANRRLARMSRGQFQLRRPALSKNLRDSQGLEIRVEDTNAGTERHAGSLSGGESFMAALSLALGLADVVQADLGGVKLDSVLIDEGFGTLDSESLDLAMKTLVDLQAGGRIVGIISHVQELKAQVLHRLEVTKTATGSHLAWNDGGRAASAIRAESRHRFDAREPSRDVSP